MQKVGCFLGKYKSTTVFLSFLQTEMDEEQMDIVDANQPQADSSIMINKSWKHPTAAKQVIIQRDAAERKQLHMFSMRISMEQSLKCREVGFEMAIHWYRVAKGHKLRRICSQGSYSIGFYLSCRRRKFGFNVHMTINTG